MLNVSLFLYSFVFFIVRGGGKLKGNCFNGILLVVANVKVGIGVYEFWIIFPFPLCWRDVIVSR